LIGGQRLSIDLTPIVFFYKHLILFFPMAGHSKWANIKRQKARVDAKKGQVFARLSRAIIVAARQGIPDPDGNFQLRSAIDKAKAAGIPNENIERAIAKGAGQLGQDGDQWEAIRYEGYGPGGIAVLIEALTDNRNRTAADLRSAFTKSDGNLGETGCVGWMFDHKGVIQLALPIDEDALLEALMDSNAEFYEQIEGDDEDETMIEVYCSSDRLESVAQHLKQDHFDIRDTELRWIPQNVIELSNEEQAQKLIKLTDSLEDLDDVQSVTTNADFQESFLLSLSLS
jgi:YebC/PmpR family DNA-binding regulatory protein